MTRDLFSVSLALLLALAAPTTPGLAQDKPPSSAGETITGCLRTARAESTPPHAARTIYTLELSNDGPAASSEKTAAGSAPQKPKQRYVLSGADSVALSKHVGQKVQLTGELLQPPSAAPGAADPTARPLPGEAEGTFRVSGIKVISSKCS